jgi:hypothetical protein
MHLFTRLFFGGGLFEVALLPPWGCCTESGGFAAYFSFSSIVSSGHVLEPLLK